MNNLIVETIESYNNYLARLPEGCLQIANKLREEQLQIALNEISNFSEGVSWLLEVGTLLIQNDVAVKIDINRIQHFFVEINDALQIEDYNLVADLFEYEIADFFKNVNNIKASNL